MTTLKRPPAHTDNLALWTWTAVALTLVGWFWGALAIAYSHLGDVTDVSMMTGGVVLFAEAPAAAVVLAIHAARAGHRSGRIAVVVSGLLLLATIVVLTLVTWWIGLAVTAVVAVLVFAGARSSSRIALAVCGWLLLASRAAGLAPPIDSVYPRLDDDRGLRQQADFARSLGFFGKSAIHPRQLEVIHDVFTPSAEQLAWAQAVLDAFAAAGGNAVKLPDGEFVDLPVADRARHLLELAGRQLANPGAADAPGKYVFG